MEVKRTFFITKEEAEKLRTNSNNPFITHLMPCYELENGEIVYPEHGFPENGTYWYEPGGMSQK